MEGTAPQQNRSKSTLVELRRDAQSSTKKRDKKRKLDITDYLERTKRSKTRDERTTVVKICRYKGEIVQDCDVYIGRGINRGGWDLPTSKWANPYTIQKYGSAEKAVALYEEYLNNNKELLDAIRELKGKVLGCWCKPGICHGDVLARRANEL